MDRTLRELVRRRAGNACEYCRLPQDATPLISFHIEHIVSRQHGSTEAPDALALACDRCNAYKGPNLTSIDPDTNAVVPLFNPRQDAWGDHFAVRGRIYTRALQQKDAPVSANMNTPRRVERRSVAEDTLRTGGLYQTPIAA